MKSMRFWLWVLVVCNLAFTFGVIAGFVRSSKSSEEYVPLDARRVTSEEESVPYKKKEITHYKVTSEGEYIILSENYDDESNIILEMIPINKSVLPEGDIMLLKEGMIFVDKNDALLMIENFVS